jgi:hypothetical protein
MVDIREFLTRESPKIRSKFILKQNIMVAEKSIPDLKKLLKRLKKGERPLVAKAGYVHYISPRIKDVEKALSHYQDKLPKYRKWLKKVT